MVSADVLALQRGEISADQYISLGVEKRQWQECNYT
jgi:hypothetical protein